MLSDELAIEFIEQHRDRPFEWGTWDCCQCAAAWLFKRTGIDHRDKFPRYATEAEAREVLEQAGGLVALVSSVLQPVHRSRAMRGDLVLACDRGGAALGICLGVHSVHVGPEGLLYFPTADSVAAWRVQ